MEKLVREELERWDLEIFFLFSGRGVFFSSGSSVWGVRVRFRLGFG